MKVTKFNDPEGKSVNDMLEDAEQRAERQQKINSAKHLRKLFDQENENKKKPATKVGAELLKNGLFIGAVTDVPKQDETKTTTGKKTIKVLSVKEQTIVDKKPKKNPSPTTEFKISEDEALLIKARKNIKERNEEKQAAKEIATRISENLNYTKFIP